MNEKLAIPTKCGLVILELRDIIYFQRMSNNTLVYTRLDETHIANKILEKYEVMLNRYNFIRIDNPYLINVDHIKTYRKSGGGLILMCNGDVLTVSEKNQSVFENIFYPYYF